MDIAKRLRVQPHVLGDRALELFHEEREEAADEIERLRLVEEAARWVLETFEKDEAQGYRSKDRQFVIALLGKVLRREAVDEQSTREAENGA